MRETCINEAVRIEHSVDGTHGRRARIAGRPAPEELLNLPVPLRLTIRLSTLGSWLA